MTSSEHRRHALYRRLLALLAAAAAGTLTAACNTTEGFGQDVQNLGENIEDKADRHK